MSNGKFSFGPSRAFDNYRQAAANYFESRSRRDRAELDLWNAEEDFFPGAPKLEAFRQAFEAADEAEVAAHALLVCAKAELQREREEDARLDAYCPSQFSHGRDKATALRRARRYLVRSSDLYLRLIEEGDTRYTIGMAKNLSWGRRTSDLKFQGQKQYRRAVKVAVSRGDFDYIPTPRTTEREVF